MQNINCVFLIDDEPMFNLINQKIILITKFAENVYDFIDANTAINELTYLLKKQPNHFPQVIFLDINMPVMDGWDFLNQLNKFPKIIISDCRVYILTTSVDHMDIERAKSYGIVKDFISKPLTIEKLISLKIEIGGQ